MVRATIDILSELLSLEERSLCRRLMESTMFVSRLAVKELSAVRNMVRASEQHAGRLAAAILDGGGTPAPRIGDVDSGDLHFQDIRSLLPRLVQAREALVRKYTLAAERVGDDADLQALLSNIAEQHREEVSTLEQLCSSTA